MAESITATKVADDVYWVGAIDWAIRNFHGYATSRGTTYNAFLVLGGERTALIDTVKAPFEGEMMRRIASVIDPAKIDVIVSNHSEMDHSGCLPSVVRTVGAETVYCSRMGAKALEAHFHGAVPLTEIADGDEIDLGGDRLSFFETRMCHWPDSMVSYLHGRKLLFSQDAFGMHLASTERFDDELPGWMLDHELAKYYANILMPLGRPVGKAIEKLAGSGLAFDLVAPDHGPLWRTRFDRVLELYKRWQGAARGNRAVVLYDTMWHTTAHMAEAIADGLAAGGTPAAVLPLNSAHRSDVATEVLEAGALLIGSPTINNQIFPTVADVLCYLKGLAPEGLIGAAFGSYGWSGEAPKQLAAEMEAMGVELVGDPLRLKYVPEADGLAACRELGQTVAARLADAYGPATPKEY